jgi:hypothetical protein
MWSEVYKYQAREHTAGKLVCAQEIPSVPKNALCPHGSGEVQVQWNACSTSFISKTPSMIPEALRSPQQCQE